jgi:tetratricopeptide (TPR) repeat protein
MSKARIFVSYSNKNTGPKWKSALLHSLHTFERHRLIDVWQDGEIRVGSFWDDDIKQAMGSARVAVLLLTAEALASRYILNTELPYLREQQQQGELRVFPVICEACDWRAHSWLRATQAPNKAKPLSRLSESQQNRVFRELAVEIAEELSRTGPNEESRAPVLAEGSDRRGGSNTATYLDNLPFVRGTGIREQKLIGREQELALLDLAHAQSHTAIVTLVAWGGVGKTILVQHWLQRLQRKEWLGARRVYAWSFYSQGTKEDRQATEDTFLEHALEWFGAICEPMLSPWEKGRLLYEAVTREPTLLILDGIEPLQWPPGPMGGHLRAPGVQTLLKQLARKANNSETRSLCVVTTREPLADLINFERRPHAAWGSVLRVDLGNLSEEAGAALLHHTGGNRAGAANIAPDDTELIDAAREVDHHALTLNLLGRFLARAHNGDIRQRHQVKFEEADRNVQGGTTFKMLGAFDRWFVRSSEYGGRYRAILQILGLFDRPADYDCIAALRKPPAIPRLTEPFFFRPRGLLSRFSKAEPLPEEDWNSAISYLADFGLVGRQAEADGCEPMLDCHPLIREFFAKEFRATAPSSWATANERIAKHLLSQVIQDIPDAGNLKSPGDFEYLFRAATHHCAAGKYSEVFKEVYRRRISRGDVGYATRTYGLFSSEISLFASFFGKSWDADSCYLTDEAEQLLLFRSFGFALSALGRFGEGLPLLSAALEAARKTANSREAAIIGRNLANFLIGAGRLAEAEGILQQNLHFADISGDTFMPVGFRCSLGYARLLQIGPVDPVARLFAEAWEWNMRRGPGATTPELPNFHYFKFLIARGDAHTVFSRLDELEKASSPEQLTAFGHALFALARVMASSAIGDWVAADALLGSRRTVIWQAGRRDIVGLWHLANADAALLGLDHQPGDPQLVDRANASLEECVDIADRDNLQLLRSECLRLRAKLHSLLGESESARADLDEAWKIAEPGRMRLEMADIHLFRARYFWNETYYPWGTPQTDLAAAEKLINDCCYCRRDGELANAKKVIFDRVEPARA